MLCLTGMADQAIELSKKPHVVVSTPGRIKDHLEHTKGFNLHKLEFLVCRMSCAAPPPGLIFRVDWEPGTTRGPGADHSGGFWHDVRLHCCLQLAAPISLSPRTPALSWNPLPFPSVGGGAHRPFTSLCPPSPCLAYPCLPTHSLFPLVGCANGVGWGIGGLVKCHPLGVGTAYSSPYRANRFGFASCLRFMSWDRRGNGKRNRQGVCNVPMSRGRSTHVRAHQQSASETVGRGHLLRLMPVR